MIDSKTSPRRGRRASKKLSAAAAFGNAVGTIIGSISAERRGIHVTRPSFEIEALGASWDGLRIAHLTDLHHGRMTPLRFIAEAVRLTNAEEPDLIVLTGDFVSRLGAITNEFSRVLAELKAPLGVLAVLGNHDYWANASGVREMLASAGARVLLNDHVSFSRGSDTLTVAGIGDLWAGLPQLDKALAGAPAEGARILLSHNPTYARKMPSHPRIDLMLSGHTHGGQIRMPLRERTKRRIRRIRDGYRAIRARRGLHRPHRCPVYVSRGIGLVGLPFRMNCRPELPIITLRCA